MPAPLPRPIHRLLGAVLPDGRTVDVVLDGDTVGDVAPASGAAAGDDDLDLSGYLLLTAPAEPHAHLDKALSWDVIRPPLGDLHSAIDAWRAHAATMTVDEIADRARAAALELLANGTTAVRSHVDVLSGAEPARGAEALVRVRAELAGLLDLELVALAGPLATESEIEAVLDAGVDLVGGAPHLADDPEADVARLVAIAERRGLGLDLHTDESLDGPLTIEAFARAVREWPADRIRTAGHCVRLGTLAPDDLRRVVAAVADADLGIVTLPITNLYLQGWEHPVSTPRGLTAIHALRDAGVRIGAGADNVRDPFNPIGRSDALETAALLVTAGHLSPADAYALVSDGARDVMGLPDAGPRAGARADLLAVRGTSIGEVVATASADRVVLHRGRLVSRTTVSRTTAAPASVLTETR